MPGSSGAALYASWGGSGRVDRWAPGPNSGRSGGRPDGPPAGRAEGSVAGYLAEAGQLQGGALCLPGRLWPRGWAGIWSRLRAVSRTARRADSGSPESHRPEAGQGPGSSGAVRCASLGRLWPSGWAPGHGSRRSGGRPDGPPVGRAEGHGPDAWQRPGSSRAVRCGSLGGSGRADGRASGHGSGQSAGRPDGPPAGRAEGHGAGAGQWPDSSRAVRCGSLGGSGRVDGLAPGHHGSRRSGGRPGGPPAGRTLTRCRAAPAQCAAAPWGGSGVAYVSRSDTISARTVLQIRPRRRILGGSWRCAVS